MTTTETLNIEPQGLTRVAQELLDNSGFLLARLGFAAKARALEEAGVEIFPGRRLDFLDPFGNRVEIVQYDQIQFTKPDHVLRGMGLELGKSDSALAELEEKGLSPPRSE